MPIRLKVAPAEYIKSDECREEDEKRLFASKDSEVQPVRDSSTVSVRKDWRNVYSQYTNPSADIEEDQDHDWMLKYGTNDPNISPSRVPCGGCGAHLHCQDPSIPGFIPQELFTECKPSDLRTLICQRCYFLQNHNLALSMAVDPKIYPKIISFIKKKNALVLLAVDLTDFPCSIWPGITDVVGQDCPLFLVGNKVDLLWGDGRGWLEKVEKSFRSCFPKKSNIIGTHLISAKTGFGVEELVTKLQQSWKYQGDMYLLGCTNVGKSTIFNALLQSDLCKVKAVDLVQKATTAPWPGTTLNLLKFPIMRPEGWRLYLRNQRLNSDSNRKKEMYLKVQQLKQQVAGPQLIGHIGMTFHSKVDEGGDAFEAPDFSDPRTNPIPGSGLNPNDPDFAKGRWFYDTPGVLHEDQILDLLTSEELMKVLPQKCIRPRTYVMKPGWTMFVGGLARVDYMNGPSTTTRWTVFVSHRLPVTICFTEYADEVYNKLLGTEEFAVPSGGAERLQKWPPLKSRGNLKFAGLSKQECCGDIVLSSSGWISLAVESKEMATVRPWTPEGRGIYARSPALLPFAVNYRGLLERGTPAYKRSKQCKF
ncbi:unnamed protein product [Nesidiocoris tenuis]|nr:unnamed protein product [Nesidiocoris tenuis]